MDRQLALVATMLCLAIASGCKRSEQRRGTASDSRSTEVVNADGDRAPKHESPAPEPVVGEESPPTTPAPAPRVPAMRRLSPERWLALQAAAAWSGKRDKPRPVVPLPSPSVAPPEGDVSPSDTADLAETAEEPSATTTPASEAADQREEVAKDDEVASESTSSSYTDEEEEKALRIYEAATIGAGSGYTGVGAGDAGYTGIGAGAGFTGIGAGNGFTGMGAGPGFTGMYASVPSQATTSTRSTQVSIGGAGSGVPTKARSQVVVLVWPVFIGPWGPSSSGGSRR